jgi:hypothetical protein
MWRRSMAVEDLEARIKTLEAMVKSQAIELRTLKDIELINRLQRAYGYYIERWMSQEIIDLFTDGPDVSLTLGAGTFLGKEGVIRYFNNIKPSSQFMHQVMQISGIVDVDPDGKSAKGRWFGWGSAALPANKGVRQNFFNGTYTAEYIKEAGIWKIKKLRFDQLYSAHPATGWVSPDQLVPDDAEGMFPRLKADIPRTFSPHYPCGYIYPFHFKHPVTGKETSERARNKALKGDVDL